MRVLTALAVVTAFTVWPPSCAIPIQGKDAVIDSFMKGCDPYEPVVWEQVCSHDKAFVDIHYAEAAIYDACQVAQDSSNHLHRPITREGPSFRVRISLDTRYGMVDPRDWTIESCTERFHEINKKRGGGSDPSNFYFGQAGSPCDGTFLVADSQHTSLTIDTRSPELPTQDVDDAVVDYRNVSEDAALWETYCTDGYADPHDAETAIHNLCQVAQYCYQHPSPDQPPIIVEGPAVMTWAKLGAGCALGRPDDWNIDSCTQAFHAISEKCGGRDSRGFYYGWVKSKRDGSVLSINHEGHHCCDPTEPPKTGVQSCC